MPNTLNLDNNNVFENEMTTKQVRDFLDGKEEELPEGVTMAFDEAQGHVFTDAGSTAWVVIKVTK